MRQVVGQVADLACWRRQEGPAHRAGLQRQARRAVHAGSNSTPPAARRFAFRRPARPAPVTPPPLRQPSRCRTTERVRFRHSVPRNGAIEVADADASVKEYGHGDRAAGRGPRPVPFAYRPRSMRRAHRRTERQRKTTIGEQKTHRLTERSQCP